MSGGRPKERYAVSVRLKDVGRLAPFESYCDQFNSILGFDPQHVDPDQRKSLTEKDWRWLCDQAWNYLEDLRSIEDGISKESFRGKQVRSGKRPRRGNALQIANHLSKAHEIWNSLAIDERDLLADAVVIGVSGDEIDREYVEDYLDRMGEFANAIPLTLAQWDKQDYRPFDTFVDGLFIALDRLDVRPFSKVPYSDKAPVIANLAYSLIEAYQAKYPEYDRILSGTGMTDDRDRGAMLKAIKESRAKR